MCQDQHTGTLGSLCEVYAIKPEERESRMFRFWKNVNGM